ncbi:MAG: ATP-binding cassette domain-containing protein, partial [Gemmatimonadetes bacterium]|nr:ATP-binding cassette domain-containing protein [Gemmatimonadota bacterium]
HDVVGDGRRSREKLGVVPQELALYEDLSARENLNYWGSAYGLRGDALKERIAAVLDAVNLTDRAKEPVKNYSGGMKRRLNFGCGIVHGPQVLLLDEPTVGVDPQSRVAILELVREQVRRGTCVLYTTHYMEEAETLCDQLAIVDHGNVIAAGTLEELRSVMGERDLLRLTGTFDAAAVRRTIGALDGVEVVSAEADAVTLAAQHASGRLPEFFAALAADGAVIRETTMTRPSLESLFIKLTGKELRE